jgi:peptidyl-prolyl cis-trans isomerase C
VVHYSWLDNLFGGGGNAEASHILIKGSGAEAKCRELKTSIEKSGGGNKQKLEAAFAKAASSNSACPSAQKGGNLGSFGKGQMVPEFDKVVFNEAVMRAGASPTPAFTCASRLVDRETCYRQFEKQEKNARATSCLTSHCALVFS